MTVTKLDKPDPKDVMANFSKGNPTMKGFFKKSFDSLKNTAT